MIGQTEIEKRDNNTYKTRTTNNLVVFSISNEGEPKRTDPQRPKNRAKDRNSRTVLVGNKKNKARESSPPHDISSCETLRNRESNAGQ